ncbi:pilus assembly protein FlpE [Phycicoccus sp. CSK15P-2]|uniref:pilus assembly protein FlpE n=1 Tax=Phycicoccus sp. CSK15P-2 TaxID=2807627 RepID=UPI00194E8492|nr:pilus assembly protein FlpE [Phycicoccus sp. CSK15P-2]MBM6404586.1 pilus assembly protein FlpE [Phycicoccus sp. CSK15P-2]
MSTAPTVVAVVGASGGLGASTLALAVGRRLAASGPPAVVADLDVLRGGLDVTAGVDHVPGRRWAALAAVRGEVPSGLLVPSLPAEDGCALLSAGGPGPSSVPDPAVRDVLASLRASGHRLVVDVPGASPVLGEVLALATHALVLTGLRTRALADADALVERLAALGAAADLRLVTRGPRPSAAVLDDVEAHLGLAHLHHLGDDVQVVRDAERGLWPGTGRDAVRRCADRVVELVDAPLGAQAS